MTRANLFASEMVKVFIEKKIGNSWKQPRPIKDHHECVDVEGVVNGQLVLIEVELRRIAPLANVVKIWKAVNKEADKKKYKNAIVFQAFSEFYPEKGTQRGNAEFIGKEMANACGIEYIALSIPFKPAKRKLASPVMKAGGRCSFHARNLAQTIIKELHKRA
jgi:hypothetical protein